MDMQLPRNKNWIFVIVLIFSIVLSSLLTALCFHLFSDDSNHYLSNVDKVVEVRAYDEEDNASYGTGWFKDEKTIVTNYHVLSYLSKGERIGFTLNEIRFSDSDNYEKVSLLGFDIVSDIAYLQYEGNHAHSSFTLQKRYDTGEKCYCIGNFSNYGLSYKEGNVSLKEVSLLYNDVYSIFIQCSIGIGQGDSGAPLFNSKNEVIGMITFRTKGLTGTVEQGFAYAIPVSRIV